MATDLRSEVRAVQEKLASELRRLAAREATLSAELQAVRARRAELESLQQMAPAAPVVQKAVPWPLDSPTPSATVRKRRRVAHASHPCDQCDEKFSSVASVLEHVTMRHTMPSMVGKRKTCECGESFPTILGLAAHLKERHPMMNAARHRKIMWRNGSLTRYCVKCEVLLRTPFEYARHMGNGAHKRVMKEGIRRGMHKCPCGAARINESRLLVHQALFCPQMGQP